MTYKPNKCVWYQQQLTISKNSISILLVFTNYGSMEVLRCGLGVHNWLKQASKWYVRWQVYSILMRPSHPTQTQVNSLIIFTGGVWSQIGLTSSITEVGCCL